MPKTSKAEAPATTENPRATIGGNAPPSPIDQLRTSNDTLPEFLALQSPDVLQRYDDLVAAFARTPATVTDDETNAKFTDFANKKIAACKSALEGMHTGYKEPYLTGGRVIDNFYLARIKKLAEMATDLRKRQTEYNVQVEAKKRREREEAERIARQQAAEAERIAREAREKAEREQREAEEKARREREVAEAAERERIAKIKNEKDMQKALELEEENRILRAERDKRDAEDKAKREAEAKTAAEEAARRQVLADEAAKLADAKSTELTRSRGEHGGVSSLRTEWKIEVENLAELDLNDLKPYASVEEINGWLKAWLKPRAPKQGGIPPKLLGAKIFEHKFTR